VHLLDPNELISAFGTVGLLLIIFSESCFAFFLPGDSLLFTAGFLAYSERFGLNVWTIAIGTSFAAILGNQVGYAMGRRFGAGLYNRPKSKLFKPEYLEKTQEYFEHHGARTIVLARFIPIVRTFACIVAGASRMNYRVFLTYNIIGGILWGAGLTTVGWITAKYLGEVIDIDKFILPIIVVIIAISLIPIALEALKARRNTKGPSGPLTSEDIPLEP
jgi:membrane-associated protein